MFTQILVKDYLEDSVSPEPTVSQGSESASHYWWNSKTTAKRKVVLPWNYPMDVKAADNGPQSRLSARKSARLPNIRRSRAFSSTPLGNTVPSASAPTEAKKRSYFCCCCGGSESGQEGSNGPQSIVDQAVQDPVISLVPETNPRGESEKPHVEDSRDVDQSNEEGRVEYDSGMGSFLDNLKKQNGYVSSISWKTI